MHLSPQCAVLSVPRSEVDKLARMSRDPRRRTRLLISTCTPILFVAAGVVADLPVRALEDADITDFGQTR